MSTKKSAPPKTVAADKKRARSPSASVDSDDESAAADAKALNANLASNAKAPPKSIFGDSSFFAQRGKAPPKRKERTNKRGDGNAMVKAYGIVISPPKSESVPGRQGQPTPKIRFNVFVTEVANAAFTKDVIDLGSGFCYVLPTKKIEDPHALEGGGDVAVAAADAGQGQDGPRRSAGRELDLVPGKPIYARQLSGASWSVYATNPGGEASPDLSSIGVGDFVEVTGITAVAKRDSNNDILEVYFNASRVKPANDTKVAKSDVAAAVIKAISASKIQEAGAFGATACFDGFFADNLSAGLDDAQVEQADEAHLMWEQLRNDALEQLTGLADKADGPARDALLAHVDRVTTFSAADLASGRKKLFEHTKYDATYLPCVQQGLTATCNVPGQIQALFEANDAADALPKRTFGYAVNNHEVRGGALHIEGLLAVVVNSKKARDALGAGVSTNPMLGSASSALAYTLSLKQVSAVVGTQLRSKICVWLDEVLSVSKHAVFPCVLASSDPDAASIESDFPLSGALFVEMHSSLKNASALVSKETVSKILCGGGGVYVAPRVKENGKEAERLELFPGAELPYLEMHKFQELISTSFDLSNWASMDLEFRVVYPGVLENVRAEAAEAAEADGADAEHASKPSLLTDEAKGLEAIEKAAGSKDPVKVKEYLVSSCLLYAIAK